MAENVTPVVLKIKDFAPREVLLVNYKFNQTTDQEGQVSGIVRGGQITIRVKAMNDGNPELLAWMLDPAAPHDLTVEFENTKDGSAMKTLKGTACYCTHYKEYWADGDEHYEEISLSCEKLENGSTRDETHWNYISAYFSLSINFQIPAAQAAPTKGPTMKIQRLAKAVPPWKMAGAIERAGFTEVPV